MRASFLHKFQFWHLSFLAILATAIFMRFYYLPSTYRFLGDQGRDALVMRDMLLGQKIQLLGPTTSVGSYYLGPFYYYLMAPSLAVTHFNPVGPAFFQALLGVMTVAVIFTLLAQKTNFMTASLGAGIAALSPILVEYSRFAWNPNALPLFTLIWIWCLTLFLETKKNQYFIGALIATSILLQLHYVTLGLVPVLLGVLAISIYRKYSFKNAVLVLTSCVVLGLSVAPLMIGLVRSSGNSTSTSLLNLNPVHAISAACQIVSLSSTHLINVHTKPIGIGLLTLLTITCSIYVAIHLKYKKTKTFYLSIVTLSSFWCLTTAMSLLNVEFELHYLLAGVPLILVLWCLTFFDLTQLKKFSFGLKALTYAIVAGVLILLLTQNFARQWRTSLQSIDQIYFTSSRIASQTNNQPFQIAVLSETNTDDPYVYILKLMNTSPVRSQEVANQLFVICEDANNCQIEGNPHWEIAKFENAHAGKDIEKFSNWTTPKIVRWNVN